MAGMFGPPRMPEPRKEQPTRTAEALDQGDDERRRRRQQASVMTQNWNKPKLGSPGLTGM